MLFGELEGNSNSFRWTGPARSQCPRKRRSWSWKMSSTTCSNSSTCRPCLISLTWMKLSQFFYSVFLFIPSVYPLHCTNPFPLLSPLTLLSNQSFSSDLWEYEYFLHFLLCTVYTSSPSKKKQQQMKTGVRCCPTTQHLTKSNPTTIDCMAGTSSTKHHFKEASSEDKNLCGSPCSLAGCTFTS